ncbi:MAG TPA: GGDEF domain-containing protein [Candidatus Angelobacter sp.]
MPSRSNIAMILFRLTLPGGLLLAIAVVFLRLGILVEPSGKARLLPLIVVTFGLILSGVFRRSRLFFAQLVLVAAQAALTCLVPHLAIPAGQVLVNAVAVLLPLNLVALAFVRERGIISPAGRRRLALVALEIIAVGVLCMPQLARAASWLARPFFPERFSAWSHLSQPGLLAFAAAAVVMVVLLVRRYRPVESSFLWALAASFAALRVGGTTYAAAIFFSGGALAMIVALLETSYKMAYHDELTQLPSRRALNEALMKLPGSYTIAMVDVDHFKRFNDTYGHAAGDQALRLVASRLAYITGGGKAYRYGGEEFAIMFPGKTTDEVFVYLDRMRGLIEQSTFVVRGKERRKNKRGKVTATKGVKRETHVTVSIGVASSNGNNLPPSEVLRAADQALYRAKAKGRNCTIKARYGKTAGSEQPAMSIVSVS